jgi:1-acyl-sn-glycerol-3-phosphate acyltransferase
MSRIDTAILLVNGVRDDLSALVADKYKSRPFFRFLINSLEGIWIDRSKADFSAFRDAIRLLKDGFALGIAPEGTRSRTGQLIEGKSGTVILAAKSGSPIVPVAISGTEDAMQKILHFKRPHIIAHFGPAFNLPELERENRNELLKEQTDEIMCRIAVLLPEKYHGYYANHPRLKELQKELAQ